MLKTGIVGMVKAGIQGRNMREISSNPVILAIESSADMASAAVITAEGHAVQQVHMARHGHAAQITELARGALVEAGVSPDDLTHVAAGRGPGSFTGIRVALAAAKGFVIATGASGIGVSCLAAMAYAVRDSDGDAGPPVLATADTRRGSFFAQLFDRDGVPLDEITEIDPDAPGTCPASWQGALVTGAGAAALATAFPDSGLVSPDAVQTGAANTAPLDAMQVARLAAARLATGEAIDPLLPLYVAPAFLGPAASRPSGSGLATS